MKQVVKLSCVLIIMLVSFSLSAQGYLVKKGFGVGYSTSTLLVHNRTYGVNSFGITLFGNLDIYYGFTEVNKKVADAAGITLYIRKNSEKIIFPAISFAHSTYDKYTTAGINFAIYFKEFVNNRLSCFIVPNVSLYFGRFEGDDVKPTFSIAGSVAWRFYKKLSIYTEPQYTFDSSIDPSISIGILLDI